MCVVLDEGHVSQWRGSVTQPVHFGDSHRAGIPPHPWCQLEAQAGEHDVLHVLHAGQISTSALDTLSHHSRAPDAIPEVTFPLENKLVLDMLSCHSRAIDALIKLPFPLCS